MSDNPSTYRSSVEAALILAVGMGFGRFAFTAVYPYMVDEGLLNIHTASLAASANYGGYLLGALLAVRGRARHALWTCLGSAIGSVLCLAALIVISSPSGVVVTRAISGVFSALSMVATALWLFEHRRHLHGTPVLFGGVGLGIALSSELLVIGGFWRLGSRDLWFLLATTGALLSLAVVPGMLRAAGGVKDADVADEATEAVNSVPLLVIYGMAGFGYIITATYLPLLVTEAVKGVNPVQVWALFGLGAIPSCFLWHQVHQRLGTRRALAVNLCVQALGVAMPLVSATPFGYLLSALLVGATFMGTVTIAMPAAQHARVAVGRTLMAPMTVVYGLGQIAGPLAASTLYAQSHSFSSSLAAAAAVLVLAATISKTLL